MKPLYRHVLQILRSYLVENLLVNDEFLDELLSSLALNPTEAEIIEHEKCNRDKIKRIILSLSSKEDSVYQVFKQCLLKTKNEYIYTKIKETELAFESGKVVTEHYEATRQLIKKCFQADKSESFITLQEAQEILLNDFNLRLDDDFVGDVLDPLWLTSVMKSIFTDLKEGPRHSKRNKKKKSNRKGKTSQEPKPGFYGISLNCLQEREYTRQRQESESSHCFSDFELDNKDTFDSGGESTIENKIIEMAVEDFFNWIKQTLGEHFGDNTAAEKFREDDIDGSVFDEMTEDELKLYLPKLGQRKKVQMEWKKLKNQPKVTEGYFITNVREHQDIRPFDCRATYKEKYTKGAVVSDIEARTGNPLFPVHKYIDVKGMQLINSRDVMVIANEVVKFGSACMNDRTNGTIHFGIKSNGEIVGCSVSHKMVERSITKAIRHLFYDGQINIALNCIRPPQFIEVFVEDIDCAPLFVIEVDVIPSSKFVEDFAFFLKSVEESQTRCLLYRFDGDLKILDSRDIETYMKDEKNKLYLSRKEYEDRKFRNSDENRNQVLKDFLCCGHEHFEPSVFPVLVLHEMQSEANEDVEFLRYVKWRVVFDLNIHGTNGSVQDYLEKNYGMVFNTNFTEDFDTRKVEESRVNQTIDNLKSTSITNWIYCNGSTANTITDTSKWKMDRCDCFRKAIEFYVDNIPEDRGRVLIPLFGNETKLIIEAAEEVFFKFRNNCLVIAESESHIYKLRDALQRRNAFQSGRNINDFFLIGLPWKQVTQAVCRFSPTSSRSEGLELPRSTGVPVLAPVSFREELCDLQIIAMNECWDFKQMSEEKKEEHCRINGENFYRGGTAAWPNFYFSDQVLVRDVHTSLVERLLDAIKGRDQYNRPVRQVVIYHQPGAGGSTTSRQLLWVMKDKYRCCLVNTVTKQTTVQINRLYMYGEEQGQHVNPVLVLADLDEEEMVARLHDELVLEGQKSSCDVYCVMIICCRVSELPWTKISTSVLLKQHLTQYELDWFKKKYKRLVEVHKNDRGCDPSTLLSFNIMKENFDMNAIDKYVTKYVRDPLLTREHKTLLKYLAFLNHFDINFQPVPVSSFDPIMNSIDWTLHLPESLRVLVTPVTKNGIGGAIACIRMTNYLLSRSVLHAVLELGKESGEFSFTYGEIAKELLGSKMIKPFSNAEYNKMFEKILADMIKKRGFPQSAEKPKPFSTLIMELLEIQDYDTAIDIVSKTYEITDDPMVAQQLARLHAEIGNWEKAQQSIEQAMKQKRCHSYLTHTCGQIYKMQFESVCKENRNIFDEKNTLSAFQIAQNAHFFFKECQRISRNENVIPQNPAGYDGEIRLAIDILKVFDCSIVRTICEKQNHLASHGRKECACKFMADLPESTLSAIQTLQADIYLLQKNSLPLHSDNFLSLLANGQLDLNRKEFEKNLARSMWKGSFEQLVINSLIDATQTTDEILIDIVINFDSRMEKTKQQIRMYLAASLELVLRKNLSFQPKIESLLKLSRHLYENLSNANPTCTLEAHLMILAFHWPLETKASIYELLCPYSLFLQALESWLKIVEDKPNKSKVNDKIMFYIAKEETFPCLIRAERATRKNVHILEGIICSNGFEIEFMPYSYRSSRIPTIKIPALHPVKLSTMWNKRADVVLGFGLHGPKIDLLDNLKLSSDTTKSTTIQAPVTDQHTRCITSVSDRKKAILKPNPNTKKKGTHQIRIPPVTPTDLSHSFSFTPAPPFMSYPPTRYYSHVLAFPRPPIFPGPSAVRLPRSPQFIPGSSLEANQVNQQSKQRHEKPRTRQHGDQQKSGDECIYWRKNCCTYGQNCKYKHIPLNKGIDLK